MHLVLRRRIGSPGCTFAEAHAAARNDQIRRALRQAKTWGEFARLMPGSEFDDLRLWRHNGGDHIFDESASKDHRSDELLEFIAEHGEEYVIRPERSFHAGWIPGYDEGDYPPFLDPLQEYFLPDDFMTKFGKRVSSFVSGSWWEFPVEKAAEMKANLEARGIRVTIEFE